MISVTIDAADQTLSDESRKGTALRILLVEDDALIGVLLVELLNAMGHVCILETTELGAVGAAFRERPNLMIADVELASGDGLSALRTILLAGPMAHILMSGDISQIVKQWPGSVVLQKPFREADLADAIRRARASPPSLVH